MDGAAEIADALAVDDADLENAPLLALRQITQHHVLHFARLKSVKIQDAVNGQLNWLVSVHGMLGKS
jgi:hypothetical protein